MVGRCSRAKVVRRSKYLWHQTDKKLNMHSTYLAKISGTAAFFNYYNKFFNNIMFEGYAFCDKLNILLVRSKNVPSLLFINLQEKCTFYKFINLSVWSHKNKTIGPNWIKLYLHMLKFVLHNTIKFQTDSSNISKFIQNLSMDYEPVQATMNKTLLQHCVLRG